MEKIKDIIVIPPDPKYDTHIRIEQKKLNVGAYCRVSTRLEQQENSYETQVSYYTAKIKSNKNWNFVGVYADEGKTATNLKFRDNFNDMIKDCYAGKIDMILTKSISRFARNTVDFLRIMRELKERQIRVIFEKENIDTMDNTGELLITILSSQAQEESRNLSENTRWGIVRKFEQGIVQVNHKKFMGYSKDENGKLIIIPEEAEIVRKIFDLYLQGYGTYKIAIILEQEGIKTVTGKKKWQGSTIHKMLQCEKYMGDAILQKTYTVDFLTKKRIKNNGYVKKYYVRNSHDPIISKELYYNVQEELKRRNLKKAGVTGKRYSSSYPLSGLIVCGECKSYYTRVTWYNRSGKSIVWRCSERSKTGIRNCRHSPTLKETVLLNVLIDMFWCIIQTENSEATSLFMNTKALMVHSLPEGKTKFDISDLTKNIMNQIMDKIFVKNEKEITVFFKSGLVMDKDFIKTIK
ncbi:MAG TPA: recombinase family protein [Clostridiales bacterium]|nr:recombinase family protein [Clostridiales bacterium]